jgi:tRNA(Ile)-lysidine synthase
VAVPPHQPATCQASGRTNRLPIIQPDLQHLSANRRYLIGVSGGRDSVALLHSLQAAGFNKLVVCHLDHRLRGRQSSADASFTRRLAASYHLDFEGASADVRTLAKAQKLSLETAARQARHEFFAEISRAHRCRQILLGHHADDAAETTLINLFRGSAGLTQLRHRSEIRVGNRHLTFIRPLLNTRRAEIDRYIGLERLKFREDASNQSEDHLRNRVRHQLVPLISEIFDRDVTNAINRAAQISNEENTYLDALLQDFDLAPKDQPTVLSTTLLGALPLPLQRRAIHSWLKLNQVSKISFEKVEHCLSLLDPVSGPAKINLPGDRHARRKNRTLFIE